jgi:His-Xaa-Ser system radical SAM maturase HxsB
LTKDEFGSFIAWNLNSWEKYEQLLKDSFIKDEDFVKNQTIAYARKNKFLAYGPNLHIIVTTLRCNHKCRYCHAAVAPMSAKNFDMTQDTAKKVVDTIFHTSSHNLTIEFQWWESLVNWDIVKYIVEYAETRAIHLWKGLRFALVTNLSLMSDEKLDYLLKHNVHISTSLDWNEEIHNYNRTFEWWNSFVEVTNWIKKINKKYEENKIVDWEWKPLKVWALLTVTKKTLNKYKEVIDTYVGLWLNWIFLRPLNPYWFAAADLKELGYKWEEFVDFYKKSMDYIIELNKKWTKLHEMSSLIYLTKMLTDIDPNYLDGRNPCGAGIWQVAYNYDWKIYTCDEWRMLARMWDDNFFLTDLKETWKETYKEIIDNETTKIMVQASTIDWLPWYNENVYKPYVWVCPVNSYKVNGGLIPNFATDEKRKVDFAILDYLFNWLREEKTKKVFESWLGIIWEE